MLVSSDESIPFLNPDTYLNHIPPNEGAAIELKNEISLFILGAALWDVLAYLNIDIKIVRTSRFSFVMFCFIFSRLFALGIFLGLSSGKAIYIVSGCLCILSLITSSFLFLQRVLAVYHDSSKWVRRAFIIFWIMVCLSDILIAIGGHPSDIPGTQIPKDSGIEPWVATSAWSSFAYDTVITLAISHKIWSTHRRVLENQNLSWYQIVSGKSLPLLSRSIFRGGLQYYLIAVSVTMVSGITLFMPSVPQTYKITVPTIHIFLMSSMASRVFRNIKLFESESIFSETYSDVLESRVVAENN